MSKVLRRMVSADILAVAAKRADALTASDPMMRERWLDNVRTSAASDREGQLLFLADYDWVPAFFAWLHGSGAELPREKEKA